MSNNEKLKLIPIRKVWRLLPAKYKKKTVVILCLTLLGTVLETLGIGMVVPALTILSSDDIYQEYPQIMLLTQWFNNPPQDTLAIFGMLSLLAVYVFKAAYLASLSWFQAKYIFGIKRYMANTLFLKYLKLPYTHHLENNSAQLLRNLTAEVTHFTSNVINPLVILTTEVTVIFAISVFLVIINPTAFIGAFFLIGICAFAFQKFTQSYIQSWGRERILHDGLQIQRAQEGLGGSKDIKIFGCEQEFFSRFESHTHKTCDASQKQYALSQFPRLWLETIGILALTVLVIISVQRQDNTSNIMPLIGLFAAAAFRILPSANRIMNSFQSLSYSEGVVELISSELKESLPIDEVNPTQVIKFNSSIELCNVSFNYSSSRQKILKNVNLHIKKGESIGVIGGSGAGKSTLVDVMLGLLAPTKGSIYVDGKNVDLNVRSWQDLIGYVPQSIFLTDESLRSNVAFGISESKIDENMIDRAIRSANLETFIETLPEGKNTLVGERGVRLSGGQMQRLGIARALYTNPQVLVLDEATSALDNETEIDIMNSVKSLGSDQTVIIIAHRLSTISHCDKVFQVNGGKLLDVSQSESGS